MTTSARGLAPIVIGHNAFFGVDHLSQTRGAERAAHFADPGRIVDVVRAAVERGAGGIMMSTHDRAGPLAARIAADSSLASRLTVYPLLPYAQKYITRANEVGMLNVVFDTVSSSSIKDTFAMAWQMGKGVITKDVLGLIGALIRLELGMFQGLNVGAVFLHDVLTDLMLALRLRSVFEFYIGELPRICSGQGAFATKNLPLLLDSFREWGLPKPMVMTHFNKAGYHMNPSRAACEQAAAAHDVDIMAMGTLASGFLKPDEAYAYLGGVANIRSVVVGVSSPSHMDETFTCIRQHLNTAVLG